MYLTQDVSKATELSVRQIQYYIEKNVINLRFGRNCGRGSGYKFDSSELFQFYILSECHQMGLNKSMLQNILELFKNIIEIMEYKELFKMSLITDPNRYFNLWCEMPHNDLDIVGGILTNMTNKQIDEKYFKISNENGDIIFNGFNFAPGSASILILDLGSLAKKQYEFENNYSKKGIRRKKVAKKITMK